MILDEEIEAPLKVQREQVSLQEAEVEFREFLGKAVDEDRGGREVEFLQKLSHIKHLEVILLFFEMAIYGVQELEGHF